MKRSTVDLRVLPVWLQYSIALLVAGVVATVAWNVGRRQPSPLWLGPVQSIWTVLGPTLIVFFVIRWLLRKWSSR